MHWGNGDALWALAVVPLLAAVYVGYLVWKARVASRVTTRARVNRYLLRHSTAKQIVRMLLTLLGLLLCILAWARPQWGEKQRTIKKEGIDVVVALDISKSMLAADATPSRLRAAKDELQRVLAQLHGDRVGLVVFAGVAFGQAPLTTDYGAIEFYLRKLDPEDMPVGGTASGRAIMEAIELMTGEKRAERAKTLQLSERPFKRAKNQIIVLITDGEDHQSDPIAAAKVAAEKGIRIFTIGFGSEQGEPIPVYRDGKPAGTMKDRAGNTVYTKLNPKQLEEIASITGGTYTHYDGRGSVANSVTTTLNALEKEELASMMRVQREERFVFLLVPGLFFLLLGMFIGERRGVHLMFWRGRAVRKGHGDELRAFDDVGRAGVFLLVGALAISALQGCDSMHETFVMRRVSEVDEGNGLLKEETADQALLAYKDAERKIPGTPTLHFDMGLAHLLAKDTAEARVEFSRALESPDASLQFAAHFNLGVAWFQEEKWTESLEAFKAALRLRPDDPDAKAAFEVALQKVYPPCSALEDALEENDGAEGATQLQAPEQKDLTLCGADDDWFMQPIYPGSIMRVKATFERLRAKEPGDLPMLPSPEALRVTLLGPDGVRELGADLGKAEDVGVAGPDGKVTEVEKVERTIGPLKLTADLLQLPPPYNEQNGLPSFVRVSADDALEFKYTVKVDVIPPCFALEDKYEDNDTAATAAVLEAGQEQPVHVCRGDEDWYTFAVSPGDNLFIDVTSSVDLETETVPQLLVELYDEAGTTVVSPTETLQTPQGPLWGVQVRDVTEARTVKLRVKGLDTEQQGPYTLHIYAYPPCPAGGDDRFEDNDSPDKASTLPRGEGPTRHLRLCPGDADFHKIEAKKGDRVVLGVRYDELVEDAEAGVAPVELRLLNADGNTIIAESNPVAVAAPEQSPVQRVVATDEVEEDEVAWVLQIESPLDQARFYDIIPMDGDKGKNQQEQQEPQDGEGEPDEQDKQDQQAGEPKDEPKPGEEKDEEKDEEKEQEKEQEAQATPAEEKEGSEEQMREILENLEESDDNFQLKKALENAPDRYIENDW